MKFQEILFNPDQKEECVEIFSLAPSNKSEFPLGYLFLTIETRPKNETVIKRIFEIAKNTYYQSSFYFSQQENFKKTVQKINNFLSSFSQQKLQANITLLSLSPTLSINFAKIGNVKILLFRKEEIFDLMRNLNYVYHSQVFSNIISGKVLENEKILILSENIFNFLWQEKILEQISLSQKPKDVLKIIKPYRRILKNFSGFMLFILAKKEKKLFISQKILSFFKKFASCFSFLCEKIAKIILPSSPYLQVKLKKGIILLIALLFLLILGNFLFK